MESLVNKHFPKDSGSNSAEWLRKIEVFGAKLPLNTLDQLIDELGGPEKVAEMTGRKGRVVQSGDGRTSYESRALNDVSLEDLNIREKVSPI